MAPTRIPPTPGRRERPGVPPVVALHRRWMAVGAAIASAAVAALALPASAHGADDVPTQWQIDARAEALQRAPEPAEKPVICIIDTGVTPTPDLDIVSRTALDGGTPDDVTAIPGHYGHGTTVAHMAAAKVNGWGSSGAFPHARIASVRIFDRLGQRVPWQRYVTAIWQCADMRPKPVVAVVAIGGGLATAEEVIDLRDAINDVRTRDHMSVVAAAGNGGGRADMPARLTEALAVGASTREGALCAFSARGQEVDLLAPGCGLAQVGWDEAPWTLDGTSFAAPLAAGVLAALRAYRSGLGPENAEALLRPGPDAQPMSHLDAAEALKRAGLAELVVGGGTLSTDTPPVGPPPGGRDYPAADPAAIDSQYQPPIRGERADNKGRTRRPISLPLPRVRLRRLRSRLVVTILNCPRAARVQIRLGRREVLRKCSRFTLPKFHAVAIRFVTRSAVSIWRRVASFASASKAGSSTARVIRRAPRSASPSLGGGRLRARCSHCSSGLR